MRTMGSANVNENQRSERSSSTQASASTNTNIHVFHKTVNKITKYAVSGAAAATLAAHPNAHVAWCLLGAVVAAFVNKAVKKVINAPRPANAHKPDPGMPSSHAQSLAYLSGYVAMFAALPNNIPAACAVVALGAYLSWLRVATGLHTVPQVGVGFALGLTNAFVMGSIGEMYGGVKFVQLHAWASVMLWTLTTIAIATFVGQVAWKWKWRARAHA